MKKIVAIRNVGRLKNYGAVGDVELKKHDLLFAENGRGKTTLCAILRSLQAGVGAHVTGRTILGSTDVSEIRILSEWPRDRASGSVAHTRPSSWLPLSNCRADKAEAVE